VHPPRREVAWKTFEPYFTAHVWPDPVVTPRDKKGRPTARPEVHVHICGGINGITELPDADPMLVRAGYLAAFHTEAVRAAVKQFLRGLKTDQQFEQRRTDDARTEFLREVIGPRLLETSGVREAVCDTLQRFERDTGVVVTDCD
jgi:hypothetical protein